jgi:hypothetical protein
MIISLSGVAKRVIWILTLNLVKPGKIKEMGLRWGDRVTSLEL